MRLLLNGDVTPSLDDIEELGITNEQTVDGLVLTFKDGIKVYKVEENIKDFEPNENSDPYLSEYCSNDDNSLSNFVLSGNRIIASGDISKVENKPYDYVCNGLLRLYSRDVYYEVEYFSAVQFDEEDAKYYLENMLRSSSNKEIQKR